MDNRRLDLEGADAEQWAEAEAVYRHGPAWWRSRYYHLSMLRIAVYIRLYDMMDRAAGIVARLLPDIVYRHMFVRMFSHGTTGEYGDTDSNNVTAVTIFVRWNNRNDRRHKELFDQLDTTADEG